MSGATATVTRSGDVLAGLLERGRRKLAEQDAERRRNDERCEAERAREFAAARAVALGAFAPLGESVRVTPAEAPEWFMHPGGSGKKVTFELWPFKEEAGPVQVSVRTRTTDSPSWSIEEERPQYRYAVPSRWRKMRGEDGEVYVEALNHDTVGDLAEAVALCERHAEEYRLVRDLELPALRGRVDQAARRMTAGEARFLDALCYLIDERMPDTE